MYYARREKMIIHKNEKYKRILAIGDLHGCVYHLQDLLAAVKPTSDDLIVTLGDYIDRGYYSKDVLDTLVKLHRDLNIVSLRGNHDALMLMCLEEISSEAYYPEPIGCEEDIRAAWLKVTGKESARLWFGNQALATLGSYCDPGSEQMQRLEQVNGWVHKSKDYHVTLRDLLAEIISQEHREFLRNTCVDACETKNFIFVHGGLCSDLPLDQHPLFPLHWQRFSQDWKPHISGKKVVCGHTPQPDLQVHDLGHTLCVDTGAYMARGFLTCVDVLSNQFWQIDDLSS